LVKLISNLLKRCTQVLLQSGLGGQIVGYGLIVHIMRVWSLWLIALALGVDLSFILCMALVPISLLIAMVPITIGGWGLREGAFVALFSRSGVATEEALAISIAYGLLHIASALPGAVALPMLGGSNGS
jgi:uncharacterized protein (TIRG00374 family)